MNIIKYIDCDGVIFNTEEGLFDEYNELIKSNPTLKKSTYLQQLNWRDWLISSGTINNSLEILKKHDHNNVHILTKIHSLKEGTAKIEYFRELGINNNIILVPSNSKKSSIVRAAGNLLIDDSPINLEDWDINNGIPIFFNPTGIETELSISNNSYPSINSLEVVFSNKMEEYCIKMRNIRKR